MQVYSFAEWKLENLRQTNPQEWDYDLPHKPFPRTCDDREPGKNWTGQEHGQNFAYYGSDDEDLTDLIELDDAAYAQWLVDDIEFDMETGC